MLFNEIGDCCVDQYIKKAVKSVPLSTGGALF